MMAKASAWGCVCAALVTTAAALTTGCSSEAASDEESTDQAFSWTSTLAYQQHRPTQVEIDDAFVYWATYKPENDELPFDHKFDVYRVAKSGGAVETIAHEQSELTRLALDATHVYWLTRSKCSASAGADGGSVRRVPKAGGPVEILAADLPCGKPSANSQLVIDDLNLYFSGDEGIHVMPKNGGSLPTLFATAGTNPHASVNSTVLLRADATTLYWGDSYGPLWAQSKDPALAASKTKLLDSSPWEGDLDASFFYFVDDGKVMRVAKGGGAAESIGAAGFDHATGVAVDEKHVYYSDLKDGIIRRIPKAGGSSTRFASSETAYDLKVDGTSLYFAHYGTEYISFMAPEYVAKSGSIRKRTKQ